MVVHWTKGQRTHAGRSTTQIGALKQIPCPRLDCLDDEALDQEVVDFDLLSKTELLPACQAHADAGRFAINEAIIRLLGLPIHAEDYVFTLRFLWSASHRYMGETGLRCGD